MQKLTSILAVADDAATAGCVLDKAVALARHFDARVALMVTNPRLVQTLTARCAAHAYDEVTLTSVARGDKPLHEFIVERALERKPDLVIKAAAGAHPLRRWTLDANDWQLAHHCPVPLLLAGMRSWSRSLRIAAAVDVSDNDSSRVARGILHTAGFIALGARGHLDVLYSEREKRDETLRVARAVKLAQLVREFHVGCERLQMFHGAPEATLPRLISARHYDLVVLGAVSHRDGATWLESLSSMIVDATDGDVVLVKSPEPAQLSTGLKPSAAIEPDRAARLN